LDTVQSMISVTVSRAVLTSYGFAAAELDRPELSPKAVHLLRPLLQSQGFDVAPYQHRAAVGAARFPVHASSRLPLPAYPGAPPASD
jgi:hypothetical protein